MVSFAAAAIAACLVALATIAAIVFVVVRLSNRSDWTAKRDVVWGYGKPDGGELAPDANACALQCAEKSGKYANYDGTKCYCSTDGRVDCYSSQTGWTVLASADVTDPSEVCPAGANKLKRCACCDSLQSLPLGAASYAPGPKTAIACADECIAKRSMAAAAWVDSNDESQRCGCYSSIDCVSVPAAGGVDLWLRSDDESCNDRTSFPSCDTQCSCVCDISGCVPAPGQCGDSMQAVCCGGAFDTDTAHTCSHGLACPDKGSATGGCECRCVKKNSA